MWCGMRRKSKICFGEHYVKQVEPYPRGFNQIIGFVDLCKNQKLFPATDSICAGYLKLCFENALRLYAASDERVKLMFGYFLYEDGYAGIHAWLSIDEKIVDTTSDCVAYSGVELNERQIQNLVQVTRSGEYFPYYDLSLPHYKRRGVITADREETTDNILKTKDTEACVLLYDDPFDCFPGLAL